MEERITRFMDEVQHNDADYPSYTIATVSVIGFIKRLSAAIAAKAALSYSEVEERLTTLFILGDISWQELDRLEAHRNNPPTLLCPECGMFFHKSKVRRGSAICPTCQFNQWRLELSLKNRWAFQRRLS